MEEKISIVIPIYNVENYVVDCIRSVLNQSYKNIEIILVDDGSKDSCPKICDDFAIKDNRVQVVHKHNGGLSSARNAGIDVATGEYIMFVDGDDYIAVNTAEYLIHIESLTNADIVQFRYLETEQINKNIKVEISGKYELVNDKKIFFDRLYEMGGEAASSCTKLYKTKLFDKIRFREGILHEDEYIIPYLFQEAKSIAYIPEQLYFYVMHKGSIIKSNFNPKKLDVFVYGDDRVRVLQELQYYDILEKEYQRQVSTMIHMFYEAYGAGYKAESKTILERLRSYAKLDISIKNKFDSIIYKTCKININFIYLFYVIDRIRHREKYYGTDMEKSN